MTLFYVEFEGYSNVNLGGLCSFRLFDIMAIKRQFNSNIILFHTLAYKSIGII